MSGGNLLGSNSRFSGGIESSRRFRILYQELEQVCQQLEGYFKVILNDPDFHSGTVYKFFNCHQIFQMLPIVAEFRAQNQ